MRRILLALAIVGAVPTLARAQSSQFGVRGLGLPGRSSSAHSLGLAGAFSLFDGESSLNPAALGALTQTTSLFTSSASWRNTTNPAGTGKATDARFPQIQIGGPIPSSKFAVGVGYSTYADRDFTLVSTGVASPRGEPINVTDTLTSLGGINDLRIGVAYVASPRVLFGAGVHFLTGSNRLLSRRSWADTNYLPIAEKAELSYKGFGFSAGVLLNPANGIAIAGAIRQDGNLDVQRDSSSSSGSIKLPLTLSGGVRLRVHRGVEFAGTVMRRNWSSADAGLREEGAIGAVNTFEASGGLEILSSIRRPAQKPLRLGVRYAELPFLLTTAGRPKEVGVSIGSGLRFAGDRGGIDLALERFQRKQGSDYRETGWIFSVGISVRSAGFRP
ncbi:MAG: hypothetical protein ABIZ70_09945 [Gemmatimonadales bacterium]